MPVCDSREMVFFRTMIDGHEYIFAGSDTHDLQAVVLRYCLAQHITIPIDDMTECIDTRDEY